LLYFISFNHDIVISKDELKQTYTHIVTQFIRRYRVSIIKYLQNNDMKKIWKETVIGLYEVLSSWGKLKSLVRITDVPSELRTEH
jgi:hypothetical protein